jgi:4-diphosphocytidyl-2-C-methyl-D-erythritol kinase
MTLTLPAPAKLNLFLHVTGRRADGYHELQTVFQLLDYGDELSFTPTEEPAVQLTCNDPGLATDANLVVKAARLLQAELADPPGCRIHLHKRLPQGGGLGGGSSDAATTLLALNQLWACGLDPGELARLGLQLGADVPVFLHGHSAWAEGVGERLQPLVLPEDWFVVLTPPCHAATRQIFSHPELTRDSAPIRIPAFPFSGTRNDCETAACLLHPEVREALNWLGSHAAARMTGTGSSVFARVPSREQAAEILALAKARVLHTAGQTEQPFSLDGFVARGVNRSVLHTALARLTNTTLAQTPVK